MLRVLSFLIGLHRWDQQVPSTFTRPYKTMGILTMIIGIVIGLVVSFIHPLIGIPILIVLLMVGIVLAMIKKEEEAPAPPPIIYDDRDAALSRIEQEINDLRTRLRGLLSQYGFSSESDMKIQLAEYDGLINDKAKQESKLEGALGDQTVEDLKVKKSALASEIAVESAKIPEGAKEKLLAPEQYSRMEKEIDEKKERHKELHENILELKAELKTAPADQDELFAKEEQLSEYKEQLALKERKLEILEQARIWLEIAKDQTMQPAASVLEGELATYISKITGEKYLSLIHI